MTEQAKTRILVIGDEESIRYAVDAGLEFLGDYDVHFARDSKTGIENKISPDLLLAYLVLPTINGIEVLDAIRNDPDIHRPSRIVPMTGHSNPLLGQLFEDVGIDRVLNKPFKLEQLKTALFD